MEIVEVLEKFRRNNKIPHCSAVVLAAGNSTRMGKDKTLLEIGGVPVVIRSLQAFQQHTLVDEIIVVTREDKISILADLCKKYELTKVKKVIAGGQTRAESSLAGVCAVQKNASYIAIHDGARPLVTEKVITDALYGARDFHAAVPAIPSTDTLKCSYDGFIDGDIDRSTVFRVQTPQIFDADLIKGALTHVIGKNLPVTDDSSAVEYTGIRTRLTEGDINNIKLTTPEDIAAAESVLRERGII